MVHGGFQNLAADVVEEDDDATRTQFAESFFDTFVLVVNGGVELQLLREPFALLWTTRNDDHSAALDICDLSSHRPCRSHCATDYDCIAWLWCQCGAYQKAWWCRLRPDPMCGVGEMAQNLDRREVVICMAGLQNDVLLPTASADNNIARLETMVPQCYYLHCAKRSHGLAKS
mmetsp:Transcript_44918/g.137166  ORF Transcript_44918/g.137166 Transcript_44918/m.137166 type:complete len:173 (+) Transcript_44918:1145-1663(+)